MKKIFILMSFCIVSLFANNIKVTVSILPQKYFVEKIAGDKVDVNVMVRTGFSPATYEPQTSQMKLLSASKVYFSIGVPFESAWLNKFENANKNMLIVDTTKGISKLEMVEHEHHDEKDEEAHHDDEHEKSHHEKDEEAHHNDKHEEVHHEKNDETHHDDEDEKSHHKDNLDPHVWLDPILVKTQAKNIYEAMIAIDSLNKKFYTKNYLNFLEELDNLDSRLKLILGKVTNSAFMVFHPSWGYFAQRYKLEQIAVEKEGKEPKPKEIVELIHESKKHNIKVIFVAPQFSQKAAKTIARNIDGNIVTIDHLSYDYETSLIKTAKSIYNSYK
jgi:zinc transport system substrate-binding protein